ncbi:MAG: hypothetical protein C0599_14800 [Salinivirgaceae bacterium]|nr:MAG: hypothetical protein C0599_14800 [Salinivirgaceae bacterium]
MNLKKIIITFLFLLPALVYGQFSFLDDPYEDIEMDFLLKKIEGKQDKSFFNVVKIVNPTDRRMQFNAQLTLPRGWNLMVEDRKLITLKPNDSILLPIRGSISPEAKGEIGYAVVASLTDSKGRSFKNKYSFINIPKKSELKYRPTQRNYYISNDNNQTQLEFNFSNRGNIDEVIYMEFELDAGIEITNARRKSFNTEFLLPINRDTTVKFDVFKNKNASANANNLHIYRVHVKSHTKDTAFENIIWVKRVDQKYENYIPDRNRLLIIEGSALNLFSDYDPVYNVELSGSFLTKKVGSVFYRFQTMGKQFFDVDPWVYSRWKVKYNYKRFNLNAGDLSNNIDQTIYGRGVQTDFIVFNQKFNISATKNLFNQSEKLGSLIELRPFKDATIEMGGVLSKEPVLGHESKLGVFGFSISKIKNLYIYLRGGMSENTFVDLNNEKIIGYGGRATIGYNTRKFKFRANVLLADRDYKGFFAGRLQVYNQMNYVFNNRLSLNWNTNIFNNKPQVYESTSTDFANELYVNSFYSAALIEYHKGATISYFAGPRQEIKSSNDFYGFNQESYLNVPTTYLTGGLRLRSLNSPLTATFKTAVGYSFGSFDPYAIIDSPNKSTFKHPSIEIGASIRSRIFRLYFTYFEGPYTLNQHFQRIYGNTDTRIIRILPQFDIFAFDDLIKLSNRTNATYDLISKTTRYNINTIVSAYPGKGWRLQLINTVGHQSTYDNFEDQKFSFTSTYFEFRVQKKFGFDQPRIQYHDLQIVFFKDLDGDGEKSNDEPGIDNVLAKIQKDHHVNDSMKQVVNFDEGGFYATELLSDIKGVVKYDNIPSGFYTVNYVALGKMKGNFSSDKSIEKFVMTDDQILYIPYKENNKIYGSVILNRSKLSNLGTINPSNIKVTATDSKGNIYSTLTNKNGEFILYVPNVDRYKINMNNIFYEHFNLVQNDFTVELNGYRQFEINFILNEKRRRINFSNNLDFDNQERNVRVIKRTNLGGSVKDAATFKPIKANIRIIDSETGNVVTSAETNRNTGQFYVSYLAGKKYKLVIMSDGYWFYSENLPADQITTFQNIKREIMLDYITVGSSVNLQAITFEPNQDNLTPESMAELDRLASILQNNPSIELEIVGHCDAIEAVENIEVAENRAKSVMTYLMRKGFKNLTYSSAANSQPLNQGSTEEDRAKNRRVEAIVISK